ncbi:EAL domain-containing response regulator [Synechococcus sp. PCC 7336]|uniref:two-component system response regulator n=1 Tax=Synechococcus sp. PCC 7336 TaxID=195250 RepID=UPI00034B43D8|nr:EAL domain-containing response regulator [Synechococcus sp. PCC 7336]
MLCSSVNSPETNILIVDDSRVNRLSLSKILSAVGYTIHQADSGAAALTMVGEQPPDLIVMDIRMPELDGYATCQRLKANATTESIPVIFISSLEDIRDKVRAFKVGGCDYILKPFEPQEVLVRVNSQIELLRQKRQLETWNEQLEDRVRQRTAELEQQILQRQQAQEELEYLALFDRLTQLPNRLSLLQQLDRKLDRAKQNSQYEFALLLFDCDRFKVVNDSLGHSAGDCLLKLIAERLQLNLPPETFLARLGADEFGLVVDTVHSREAAQALVQWVRQQMKLPFQLQGREVFIDVCSGVALGTADYDSPEHLLRDADAAMYRAKQQGPDRHKVFDTSMYVRAVARLDLENDLRRAVPNRELELYYQPIVSLTSDTICGFEALLRWNHPERPISPAKFIPIAEETGAIVDIGQWCLQQACSQLRQWQDWDAGLRSLSVSVNISARQFIHSNLLETVDRVLLETQLDSTCLKLELTESALMDNANSARNLLQALRDRQIQLCIDDFGTGYSSMSYLQQLPLNILKVDRSFVREMGRKGGNPAIVLAIVTLAHSLGLHAIAEGVETQEQMQQLREMGCEFGQGYLIAKPLSALAAGDLLKSFPSRLGIT